MKKINKFVGIFYQTRHILPQKCRRVLYFSFVFSYLYYCAEIYGNVPQTCLKRLQLVQNRALRALQFRNKYYPINEMHNEYAILKVHDIVQYKQFKIIHSLLTGDKHLPTVMNKLIVPIKNIHTHKTRNTKMVYAVKSRRPIGKRLLNCNASKELKNLPRDLLGDSRNSTTATDNVQWTFWGWGSTSGRYGPRDSRFP